MLRLSLVFLLLLFGCAKKVEYKIIEPKIDTEAFVCPRVEAFNADENTTKTQWFSHIISLRLGYDICSDTIELLRSRYGK